MEKHLFIFLFYFFSSKAEQWNPEWENSIISKIETENFKTLISIPINNESLKILNCSNYNRFAKKERVIFWNLVLKSLAKAESNYHPIAKSVGKSGSGNYGLLQISRRTARTLCDLQKKEDLFNPEKNLECGLYLLKYQLYGGAKDLAQKKTRPDTLGKIFTSPIFFWGPLRAKDFKGRKRFLDTFQNDPNFSICQN